MKRFLLWEVIQIQIHSLGGALQNSCSTPFLKKQLNHLRETSSLYYFNFFTTDQEQVHCRTAFCKVAIFLEHLSVTISVELLLFNFWITFFLYKVILLAENSCYVMWNSFTVGSLQFWSDSTVASLETNQNRSGNRWLNFTNIRTYFNHTDFSEY